MVVLTESKYLPPNVIESAEALGIVLAQLAEPRFINVEKHTIMLVPEAFLNLHTSLPHKYTINKFKNILYKLDLKSADFAKITRGVLQDDGSFFMNPDPATLGPKLSKKSFYEGWLTIMQKDLGESDSNPGNLFVFGNHKNLRDIPNDRPWMQGADTSFEGTNDEIARIDAALIDKFGFPAFVSLLAGIMTFKEDSSRTLGYGIDFINHPREFQSKMLRNFVGRAFHDTKDKPIGNRFFNNLVSSSKYRQASYWGSIFTLGFKRERYIIPFSSEFLDKYFQVLSPKGPLDYLDARNMILNKIFSIYIGENKKTPELNKMNFYGRKEIFNFLFDLLSKTYENKVPRHSGEKTFLANRLIQYIMASTSAKKDFVHKLNILLRTHSTQSFAIGGVEFEVDYDTLIDMFTRNKLTLNSLYTFLFSRETIANRDHIYYNDFDLAWKSNRDSKGFDERFETAHDIIKSMIEKIPNDGSNVIKVKFYPRKRGGIDASTDSSASITSASVISTSLTQTEFEIDLSSPSKGIISMLTWMMLEPNMFAVVKWNSENFIYLDIFNMFDQSHIDSSTYTIKVPDNFVWGSRGIAFMLVDYKDYQAQFDAQFKYGDIMHFTIFHNYELDGRFNNIIDYISDKIFNHFIRLGKLEDGSTLIDLR
ncbi:hypothetical protein LCGC14_1313080 [marine sediment metagenome]|uniref:Uncharacterized protein n=1 Tax=marine sediment metagenome TaxID=412755 RepID=A0A0F9KM99_9ZZZZ